VPRASGAERTTKFGGCLSRSEHLRNAATLTETFIPGGPAAGVKENLIRPARAPMAEMGRSFGHREDSPQDWANGRPQNRITTLQKHFFTSVDAGEDGGGGAHPTSFLLFMSCLFGLYPKSRQEDGLLMQHFPDDYPASRTQT